MNIQVSEVQGNLRLLIEIEEERFIRYFPPELSKIETANRLHSLAAELRGDLKPIDEAQHEKPS